MKRDEHKTIIQNLLGMIASEHQAEASLMLTNLSEDYEQVLTTSEASENNLKTANNKIRELRDANSELFLKVGFSKATAANEETNPTPTNEEDKPLPFSDLFNEKGELI